MPAARWRWPIRRCCSPSAGAPCCPTAMRCASATPTTSAFAPRCAATHWQREFLGAADRTAPRAGECDPPARASVASGRATPTTGSMSTRRSRCAGCTRRPRRCSCTDTRTARAASRWHPGYVRHVLSDWEFDEPGQPPRGQVLRLSAEGFARLPAGARARGGLTRARADPPMGLSDRTLVDSLARSARSAHPATSADSGPRCGSRRLRAIPSSPAATRTTWPRCAGWRRCSWPARNLPARAAWSRPTRSRPRSRCRPACRSSSSAWMPTTASSASSSIPTRWSPGASMSTMRASSTPTRRRSAARRCRAGR